MFRKCDRDKENVIGDIDSSSYLRQNGPSSQPSEQSAVVSQRDAIRRQPDPSGQRKLFGGQVILA